MDHVNYKDNEYDIDVEFELYMQERKQRLEKLRESRRLFKKNLCYDETQTNTNHNLNEPLLLELNPPPKSCCQKIFFCF